MVSIRRFHCCGPGSIPGRGTEIPQAVWPKKKAQLKSTYLQILVSAPKIINKAGFCN